MGEVEQKLSTNWWGKEKRGREGRKGEDGIQRKEINGSGLPSLVSR